MAADVEAPARWPTKPPKGQRCDASTGSGSDHLGQPVIYGCRNEATETLIALKGVVSDLWVCSEHAEAWEANGTGRRNPRRKR